MDKQRTFYRRNLPHIQPIGATFFVTIRLKDSIPKHVAIRLGEEYKKQKDALNGLPAEICSEEKLKIKKRYFVEFDRWLDSKPENGPAFLADDQNAAAITEQLHRNDGSLYHLAAYCVMPNHVHILFDTAIQLIEIETANNFTHYVQLQNIMKLLKGASANKINLNLGRSGRVWQRESFDHYIRNEAEYNNVIAYILNNPVKAGFVTEWQHWKHSFWADK